VVIGDPLIRVRVMVQREVLDRQLAEGADPTSDHALGLRAAQLCRVRTRRVLARRLRRTVRAAQKASGPRWGFLPLARDEILAESDAAIDLVRRLEAPGAVAPMGVALARLLVTDPVSPLSVPAEPGTLYTVLRLATAAMGPTVKPPNTAPQT
jgi:hypothetical protein